MAGKYDKIMKDLNLDKERDEKLEKLTSSIQRLLNGNPALLVGSGCSVPYGLPTMGCLAREIKKKLSKKYENEQIWKEFISELDSTQNLEITLDKVTLSDEIQSDLIWAVWSKVNKKDLVAKKQFSKK